MITYKDIRIAINEKLATTGIKVNSRDVTEGYSRPSFFVQLNQVERGGSESQVRKSMTAQIYYFPTDRYEYAIEVLEMQETLDNLFDLKLPIKDRLINVDEYNSFMNEGVLNVLFDIEFEEARNREKYEQYPNEPMQELEFNKE